MAVYTLPEEFLADVPSYDGQQPYEAHQQAEQAFLARLVSWVKDRAKSDPYAGAIVRWPVADGYAQYLVAATRPVQLVHLPLGDGWQYPLAQRATRKDIVAQIESAVAWAQACARAQAGRQPITQKS